MGKVESGVNVIDCSVKNTLSPCAYMPSYITKQVILLDN